jgi:hypothetical protein
MDILICTGVGRSATVPGTLGANFRLFVEEGGEIEASAAEGNFTAFPLPEGAGPFALRLEAKPVAPTTHPVTAHFEYRGKGNLAIVPGPDPDAPTDVAELMTPLATRVAQGNAILVSVFFSRVRDATARTLQFLATVPAPRKKFPAPTSWDTPAASVHVIGSPPVAGGAIVTASQSVDPNVEVRVLELKLSKPRDAPHFIAVTWPKDLPRTTEADPTPFVVYFHAGMAQNAGQAYEGAGTGTYPNGWDYQFFGLWRYLQYMGDPLIGGDAPFSKGLPYQVAAAGKKAVVILPLSSVQTEVGVLMSGDSMLEALLEVQSYMFRREGVFTAPSLGRGALGSFSSGNLLVNSFLSRNQSHKFCQEVLKEVYMFDAPGASRDSWVNQVTAWQKTGDAQDKVARAYVQTATAKLAQFVGVGSFGPAPLLITSGDGKRSVGVLPLGPWANAVAAAGGKGGGFQQAHQLMSAVMMTDALRRSPGF